MGQTNPVHVVHAENLYIRYCLILKD